MIPVVTLLLCVAAVSGNCPVNPLDKAAKVFKAYDTDNNGKISRSEGVAVFRKSDNNNDGALTPNEFSTELTFYNSNGYMPFFRAGDENNDGKLDFEEGNKAFDYFDNNEDGEISMFEFSTTWNYLDKWFNANGYN